MGGRGRDRVAFKEDFQRSEGRENEFLGNSSSLFKS